MSWRLRYARRRMNRPPHAARHRPPQLSGRTVAVVVLTAGVAIGLAGVWWMQRARPRPGAYIDVLALGGDDAVAVRHERSSPRAFVEMIAGGRIRWQALVP